MGKKGIIIGIIIVFILVGATYLVTQMVPTKQESTSTAEAQKKFDKTKMYYFWGDGCPHCAELDKWIKQNNITQKVKFTKLEVWKNAQNAALMNVAVDLCKQPQEGMGVPFVYYNGKCYVGTVEAQEAFNEAAK